jgi:hypothetical protein
MACPITSTIWHDEEDPQRYAPHATGCPACQQALTELARLQALLGQEFAYELPVAARPADALRWRELPTLSCDETLSRLEAWRDGALAQVDAFQVDDHLLWCASCAEEAERAETLSTLLITLPILTPPATIAERVAAAQLPWWQRIHVDFTRLWQPAYSWAGAAAVLAVGILLAGPLSRVPQVAHGPQTELVQPTPPRESSLATLPRLSQPINSTPQQREPVAVAATRVPSGGVVTNAQRPVVFVVTGQSAPAYPKTLAIRMVGGSADLSSLTFVQPNGPTEAPPVAANPAPEPTVDRSDSEMIERLADIAANAAERSEEFVASARDALLDTVREAELASMEEALSTLPEATVVAMVRRPEPIEVVPANSAPPVAVHIDEIRRSIADDLRRRTSNSKPAPITVLSTRSMRAEGVLFTID